MQSIKRSISFLFLSLWLLSPSSQAQDVITISSGEWPPYISQQLPHYGVTSQIVSEAFEQVGVTVKYEFLPWSRALEAARAGELDASLGWAITEERKQDFWFSEQPISTETTVLFYHKDSPLKWGEVWRENLLKPYRVGGTLGYEYGEKFDNKEKEGHFLIRRYNEDKLGFRFLLKKQIDFFPIDLTVARHILKQHFPLQQNQFGYIEEPLYVAELYLLISKKTPQSIRFKQRFDEGMKRLQASGRLAELKK